MASPNNPIALATAALSNPLADYWHPVALSSAVTDKPLGVKLLDTEIVLWRSEGQVHAFYDLCMHRGTRLSLGWVDKGELVCPYHGWCYNAAGSVTKIPSIPADRPIPSQAKAMAYKCKERYGLVFVCLGNPKHDIYDVPEFESDKYRVHLLGPVHWNTSAGRSFENFFDEAHLPWAHPGLLGDPKNPPVIPSRDLKMKNNGFYIEFYSEAADRLDPTKTQKKLMTHDIELPYTLYHKHVGPEGDEVLDLFLVSPVSAKEAVRFMVVGRNFAMDQPPDKFIAFTTKVWEQDKVLIESQRPEQIPIDWNQELQVRGPDTPSTAYRKLLIEMGVGGE